jgi:NTE family protein
MNGRARAAADPRRCRVALVLGAGGSVGHAYLVGVLSALGDEVGWDARHAELIVGTSAGSVVAAGLRAGLAPSDMRARALGRPLSGPGQVIVGAVERAIAKAREAEALADSADELGDGNDLAARLRRYRMASPERVRRALREPWRVTPGSLFSAMVPPGRLPTAYLGAPYDALFGADWPTDPLWIVAVKLDVGVRVVFGREGGVAASVGAAVQASCAVPGYFAPVTLEGERYVDGGAHSTTNADLAARLGAEPDAATPDLAIVVAPMSPEQVAADFSARSAMRQLARRWLAGEVAALRRHGVEVVTFQPTPEDLTAMSGSSMDPSAAPVIVEQAYTSTRARVREPDVADRLALLVP